MLPLLCCDSYFESHETGPNHPESPDRLMAVRRGFRGLKDHYETLQPGPPPGKMLERVHRGSYIDRVREFSNQARPLDVDTRLCEESYQVAAHAAGTVLDMTRRIIREDSSGFAAIRPPGHHAEPDRGMGFCLFNNIGVAAAAVLDQGMAPAIVDIDLHHGNGTQEMFYDREEVLYVSFHQYPFFPGTGAREEQGEGTGRGTTVNLPLPPGSGWSQLKTTWEEQVKIKVEEFAPDVILVSAGFDGHHRDPLGGLDFTDDDYLTMAGSLRQWAKNLSKGRILGVLEGGYNLKILEDLVPRFVGELTGA